MVRQLHITKREYEVLIRLTMSDADIANELSTSTHNVRSAVNILFKKFNAQSRAEALIKALRYELVSLYNIHLL